MSACPRGQQYRYYLKEVRRHGLAKLLLAAPWNSRRNVQEVYHLVDQWAAYERPLDALEILDADFPDARVRRLAVQCLELRVRRARVCVCVCVCVSACACWCLPCGLLASVANPSLPPPFSLLWLAGR